MLKYNDTIKENEKSNEKIKFKFDIIIKFNQL